MGIIICRKCDEGNVEGQSKCLNCGNSLSASATKSKKKGSQAKGQSQKTKERLEKQKKELADLKPIESKSTGDIPEELVTGEAIDRFNAYGASAFAAEIKYKKYVNKLARQGHNVGTYFSRHVTSYQLHNK